MSERDYWAEAKADPIIGPALTQVRAAYGEAVETLDVGGDDRAVLRALTEAVRDLLGLDDTDEPDEDDGAPCCRAVVTSGDRNMHEPDCYKEKRT